MNSSDIYESVVKGLAAEKSDYYDPQMVSAINMAVNHVFMAINLGLGQRKFGEEIFRDVTVNDMFRTSSHGRLQISSFPKEPWTVLGIDVEPSTVSSGVDPVSMPDDSKSYHRPDLVFLESNGNGCTRLNIEEWSEGINNPFVPGYSGESLCDGMVTYAFLNPVNFRQHQATYHSELQIRPAPDKKLVCVFYVAQPSPITEIGDDDIMLPSMVFNVVVRKTTEYLLGRISGLIGETADELTLLLQQ